MGNRLKEIRARNRVTQFELRLRTGIHQSKISLAENNFVELSNTEKARIARALNVSPAEIWDYRKRGEVNHGRKSSSGIAV